MINPSLSDEAVGRRFQGHMSDRYLTVMRGIPHLAEMDEAVRQAIGEYTRPAEGPIEILEIGCGPGRATEQILSSRTDLHVTAIDNEPKLVLQAKHYLAEALHDGLLTLLETDAKTYLQAASDNHWDMVVEVLCLHNLERGYRDEVLREIHRTLKPGGLLIMADKFPPDHPSEFSRVLQDHMALFIEGVGASGPLDLLKEVLLHELADFAPERIMRENEALQSLAALGFRDCRFVFRKNFDSVLLAGK